ncbi:MAG: GntR family transcriptional regulator [Devosia sp.]
MAAKIPRKTAAEAGVGSRLSDLAYKRVFEIMFERKLPAGAFVSQAELVELTGVPLGPLRDALRVLEAEGILTIHPRTGIQFVKPGLELTRSTYELRGIIETSAVGVFAETAPDSQIDGLIQRHKDACLRVEEEGLTDHVRQEIEDLELLLHSAIVGSLHNPLVDTIYSRIHNYLRMLRLDRRMTTPLALRSLREHLAVLDACRARNASAAVAAIQTHFGAALQRNLGLY